MLKNAKSWLVFFSILVCPFAHAASPIGGWKAMPRAGYLIHGGSLADRQTPTATDKKLSIVIDGPAAKELFTSIGPDLASTCSDEKGDRERRKKGVVCLYAARDSASAEGPYRCWIGIDLRTGDSVGTVSC